MGDPKKLRKKYKTPSHPWEKSRIEEEKKVIQDYGLKSKNEIWKMSSILKKFKQRTKESISLNTPQSEMEKSQLLKKLQELGLTEGLSTTDKILGLTTKDIMDRRLQTIVFRKGMARSMIQARQLITHRHIIVGEKKITSPSYLVKKAEEDKIRFVANSSLANPEHPERAVVVSTKKKEDTTE